ACGTPSPRNSDSDHARTLVTKRTYAIFPPRLDPVLDSRIRDKNTMVSPEVPACWPVRQAVLDHEPHRQVHHAVGVLTTGWGEIGEVRVKVLATLRTVMLRIGDDEMPWTPEVE